MTFLTYSRRFTASVASLSLARHTSTEGADALTPFADAASAVMDDLADALASEHGVAPLSQLGAVDLVERPRAPLLRVRMDRLAGQIRMMHEAVDRWTSG
jgi:hypothetical protein